MVPKRPYLLIRSSDGDVLAWVDLLWGFQARGEGMLPPVSCSPCAPGEALLPIPSFGGNLSSTGQVIGRCRLSRSLPLGRLLTTHLNGPHWGAPLPTSSAKH